MAVVGRHGSNTAIRVPVFTFPRLKPRWPFATAGLQSVGLHSARLARCPVKPHVEIFRLVRTRPADIDTVRRILGQLPDFLRIHSGRSRAFGLFSQGEHSDWWREQLDLLVTGGVSEDELQRVKAQVIASQVYRQDSVLGQASQIGRMRSLGLPHDAASVMTRKLREVTPDQVRAVARKYLVDDKLTIAILDPQPMAEVGDSGLIRPGETRPGADRPGSK